MEGKLNSGVKKYTTDNRQINDTAVSATNCSFGSRIEDDDNDDKRKKVVWCWAKI